MQERRSDVKPRRSDLIFFFFFWRCFGLGSFRKKSEPPASPSLPGWRKFPVSVSVHVTAVCWCCADCCGRATGLEMGTLPRRGCRVKSRSGVKLTSFLLRTDKAACEHIDQRRGQPLTAGGPHWLLSCITSDRMLPSPLELRSA